MENDTKKLDFSWIPIESQKLEKILERLKKPIGIYIDSQSDEVDREVDRFMTGIQKKILEFPENDPMYAWLIQFKEEGDYRKILQQDIEIAILSHIIFTMLTGNSNGKNFEDIVNKAIESFDISECISIYGWKIA